MEGQSLNGNRRPNQQRSCSSIYAAIMLSFLVRRQNPNVPLF